MFLASSTDMAQPTQDQLDRLGAKVREARERTGLIIDEIAQRAGISPNTWARVERAEGSIRRLNQAAIERTLGWPHGTFDALLSGKEPPTEDATTSTPAPPTAGTPNRDAVLAYADEMVDLIWSQKKLSVDEKERRTEALRVEVARLLALGDSIQRQAS